MRALALAALCAAGCLDFEGLANLYQADAGVADLASDGPAEDLSGSDGSGGACPAAAGPIMFVDSSSVTQGQPLTATLTIPRPPSVQPCDVMILMFYADGNAVITDPDPGVWNKFIGLPSAFNFDTRFYWHTATANEPSSYDVSMTPEMFAAGNIVAYRGVDPKHPIELTFNSVCHAPPTTMAGFTPSHANDQIVALCTCDTGFGSNPNFSTPSGMLLRTLTIATAVWDAPQASGAVPSRNVTCTTGTELCCVELALSSTP